jgi:hypothetical protein
MTDAYDYYGEPEQEFDPTESTDQWLCVGDSEINLSDSHFCILKRHDMMRVQREAGLRQLVVLAVIKLYGNCWASPWTIARLSGCRDIETLQGYIDDLIRIAAVERITIRGREAFRVIESDGPPKPYVMVHRAWMEHYVASRDIWTVCGRTLRKRGLRQRGRKPAASIDPGITPTAAAVLWLMQSRGRTFNATSDELAAECGLSRKHFLEIANLLRDYGLISFRRAGNSTLWTTNQGCGKNPAEPAKVVTKILQNDSRLSQKSCMEVDVKLKQVDVVLNQEYKQDLKQERSASVLETTVPKDPNEPPNHGN